MRVKYFVTAADVRLEDADGEREGQERSTLAEESHIRCCHEL